MSFFLPFCPKCRQPNDAPHECCFLDVMITEREEKSPGFTAKVESAYERLMKLRKKLGYDKPDLWYITQLEGVK